MATKWQNGDKMATNGIKWRQNGDKMAKKWR